MRKQVKEVSKRLLLYSCVLLFSFGQVEKGKEQVTNWMNINYVKCLENKLPCECERETGTYFVMHLDTAHSVILLLKYENLIEEEGYSIKRETKNSYKVINSGTHVSIGRIVIKGNMLRFYDTANKAIVFNYYGKSEFSNDIKYVKRNIFLLNKAFNKRGYGSLETILNDSSLNCHCNNDLGKMNFIWNDNGSKSWVLERKNDSLFINTVFKSGDTIVVRKSKAYKW